MEDRTATGGYTCGSRGADVDGGDGGDGGDRVAGGVAERPDELAHKLRRGIEPRPSRPKEEPRLKRPPSRRSGGPRTGAGKAAASKNSLTHGAYATRLPDFHEFYTYADGARAEFRPSGLIEEKIVTTLAHEAYKSDRIEEIERGRMISASGHVKDPQALAAQLHFPWAKSHAELLLEPVNEALLQRLIHSAWTELAAPPSRHGPGQLVTVQDQRVLDLYEPGCELLGSRGLVPYMHEDFFLTLDVVMHDARGQQSYLGRRIRDGNCELVLVHYWMYRNALRVSVGVQQALQAQVLDAMSDERLSRASSHISSRINEGVSSLAMVRAVKDESSDRLFRSPVSKTRARVR